MDCVFGGSKRAKKHKTNNEEGKKTRNKQKAHGQTARSQKP
jgi:hypothetical protein